MSFMEIGSKLINLDHVKAVLPSKFGTKVIYTDGSDEHIKEDLGRSFEKHDEITTKLKELTAPVVAAAPGFQILDFRFPDMEPTVEDVLQPYHRKPIIAWRLDEYGPTPIALDEDNFIVGHPAGEVAILYPDGCVVELAERRWDDVNAWATYVCEKWIEWRKKKKSA